MESFQEILLPVGSLCPWHWTAYIHWGGSRSGPGVYIHYMCVPLQGLSNVQRFAWILYIPRLKRVPRWLRAKFQSSASFFVIRALPVVTIATNENEGRLRCVCGNRRLLKERRQEMEGWPWSPQTFKWLKIQTRPSLQLLTLHLGLLSASLVVCVWFVCGLCAKICASHKCFFLYAQTCNPAIKGKHIYCCLSSKALFTARLLLWKKRQYYCFAEVKQARFLWYLPYFKY